MNCVNIEAIFLVRSSIFEIIIIILHNLARLMQYILYKMKLCGFCIIFLIIRRAATSYQPNAIVYRYSARKEQPPGGKGNSGYQPFDAKRCGIIKETVESS